MIEEKDFSKRKSYPGTSGNPFDTGLHLLEKIQQVPGVVFAFLLLILAFLPGFNDWLYAFTLWVFFLLDWMVLSFLPRAKRSFGPPQPPTLLLAFLRSPFAFLPPYISIPLQLAGTLIVIYAFWIEPFRIHVTRQVLASPKIKSASTLRILHLGDLHIERITPREKQLSQLIKQLQPDLILFSGDILNLSYLKEPDAWQAARQVIAEWQAPLGVYLVSGSPAVDLAEVLPDLLAGLPVTWLQNQQITVQWGEDAFDIVGLSCTHHPQVDGLKLAELSGGDTHHVRLLLYHSPDLAPIASHHDIDLQLSGHTHGGQVRLPLIGALFTGSLYGKAFEAGRYQLDKMVLYVTRGLGMEGAAAPRLRFFCPPEIILWEIKRSES